MRAPIAVEHKPRRQRESARLPGVRPAHSHQSEGNCLERDSQLIGPSELILDGYYAPVLKVSNSQQKFARVLMGDYLDKSLRADAKHTRS